MKKLLAVAALIAFCTLGCAEDKKKPKLGIGDAAPKWKVSNWLNGDEVKGYEKDKVYVVEFWATWCGPCIKAMPHLEELYAENKAKGLVVIGMTTKDDDGNDLEAVTKFVESKKGKLNYPFAFCETRDTDKAFMGAAEEDGIPCSFVVDQAGKIAYIGHPKHLDAVLPKVLAGTWKGQADADELGKKK